MENKDSFKSEQQVENADVQKYIQYAKNQLKRRFNIDHFSVIEGVALRKITEEVVKGKIEDELRRDQAWDEGRKAEAYNIELNMPAHEVEIMWKWLHEMYGINKGSFPTMETDNEEDDEKFSQAINEHLRRLREDAHNL